MIGRIVPGFLSRRVGVFNMVTFTSFSCAAVIFAMFSLQGTSRGPVAGLSVFFGLFSGSYVTLLAPTLTLLADGPAEIGARVGIGFAFQGIGGLVGTPVTGALLTGRFEWWRGIIFAGTVCAASTFLFVLSRLQFKKRRNIAGWII